MSRRQFLLSVCGAATTLLALDACSKDQARRAGQRPGGTFSIPKEATTEPDAARAAIAGEEVVFDIQNHLLDYTIDPATRAQPFFGGGFPQANCGERDPHDCFSIAHFLEEVFIRSDTSMVVVSGIPVALEHSPESIAVRERARQVAHTLCHDDRVLVQGEAQPTMAPLPAVLDAMETMARQHRLAAWKVYTHAPGPGWWLDDHDRSVPQVGEAFIRKVADSGVPRICVHKGIGGGNGFASPVDVGPAARKHRDVSFIVYHSGWEPGTPEGPYVEGAVAKGVDRLIVSLRQAGIGPNQNVYAELGTTWWNLMKSPTEAAHVLGKLLKHVGQDNVVWGTDSIWYGSPQDQIQAFRSFEISTELQERHGYPALSKELKAKVLGGNGLRLHGVKPITGKCQFSRADLEQLRVAMPGGHRTYGPSA